MNQIDKNCLLSRIGMGLILSYVGLASIFYSSFAEIHLTVPGLPFPVFLGEIVIFICLLLFMGIKDRAKIFSAQAKSLLMIYFVWIVVKALINFVYDGPLAFRNAALFYYAIFAVLSYCFYQKAKISSVVLNALLVIALMVLLLKGMVVWAWWTYVVLAVVLIIRQPSLIWRRIGWLLIAALVMVGPEYLYKGPRAHFLSVLCSVVFLIGYLGVILMKKEHILRLTFMALAFIIFFTGFFIFSDKNAINSVTSIKGVVNKYNEFERIYQKYDKTYIPKQISVQLYHPNTSKELALQTPRFLTYFQSSKGTSVSVKSRVPPVINSFRVMPQGAPSTKPEIAATKPMIAPVSVTQPSVREIKQAVSAEVYKQPDVSKGVSQNSQSIASEVAAVKPMIAPVSVAQPATSEPKQMTVAKEASAYFKDLSHQKPVSQLIEPAKDTVAVMPAASKADVQVQKSTAVSVVKPYVLSTKEEKPALGEQIKKGFNDMRQSHIREGRSLDINENNIVFRLFVWRDMARDLMNEKAVFGVSFGKPQRSRSLEVIGWAVSEWGRDGWITPHNSFFHIIYRSGLIGLLLIWMLGVLIVGLVKDFYRMHSIEGGLLVAALVYWLVLSNFFVILELPHNAVIFWSLLGVVCAKRDMLKQEKSLEGKTV